ncbi:hypothetical protein AV649_10425 [Rossellomorea marisflavi]|uniref:Uncharacterized protein n=1 Tax=Rossellomorea marisflavi TaxID=189381 RepID=A0A161RGY1_9BACI|nr:hypothetical protein AV649_10425 [Rossellomorea marisflavi]
MPEVIPASFFVCLSHTRWGEDRLWASIQKSQSSSERKAADSKGKSGQGEILQACRSGSPHAPWKAAAWSGEERALLNIKKDATPKG